MLKKYDSMLSLEHTEAKKLFDSVDHPWEVLPKIKEYINVLINTLDESYIKCNDNIYIHSSCKLAKNITIEGPTIIGPNTEIRPGAYIRGNVIIGANCVIGNSSEIKNAIIFDNAQCPHFNYVGDAVLGYKAHTGAGVILSNLKSDKSLVNVVDDNNKLSTGLKKFSAILGDNVEVGCNSVLCPGSVVFENSNIYPLSRFRGTLKANMIYKNENEIVEKIIKKGKKTEVMENKKQRMFGTDGIRGIYNKDLTHELAYKVGVASAQVLGKQYSNQKVLIGRDTRYSGTYLVSELSYGLMSEGVEVFDIGVIPTPAISYLVKELGYTMGVMITASHNPSEYNGIKLFDENGFKLPDSIEDEIENKIINFSASDKKDMGKYHYVPTQADIYTNYIVNSTNLSNFNEKVVVDCANGASRITAQMIFNKLGINAEFINTEGIGLRINKNCGSTCLSNLKETVLSKGASLGIAFDGDADRCLMVDEHGNEISGDQILAIISNYLKKNNQFDTNTIVGTIMSNLGLKKYCEKANISFVDTKVGDRYILESMLQNGYKIGGEQSGHIIFKDYLNTGAGELTAVKVLEALKNQNLSLSEASNIMEVYPQVLVNVETEDKTAYKEDIHFNKLVLDIENKLNGNGRVLIRPSGTENLIRVMIEGLNNQEITEYANALGNYLQNHYGVDKGKSRVRK